MKWSHSSVNTILNNPMEFYLSKIQGISLKTTKSALAIGSAVHWGIEHNTEDLTEFYKDSFKTIDSYTKDELLAESMVHGYLKHKDEIFEEILTYNGKKLELLDEIHELKLEAKMDSFNKLEPNNFLGIIDLLLYTDEGFIIIDYKTSSKEPDWSGYTDQLYRYIYLVKQNFPEVPILKIGIINLKKAGIRPKLKENNEEFLRRLRFEYDLNEDNYVCYHEFLREEIDDTLLNRYITNLQKTVDFTQTIVDNNSYFINYANATTIYGKSDYYDIYYHTPDAYVLYKISDKHFDEELCEWVNERDCLPIDMTVIEDNKVLNHYSQYKELRDKCSTIEILNDALNTFTTDPTLLKLYDKTYQQEISNQ